jgi:hypothetical protein
MFPTNENDLEVADFKVISTPPLVSTRNDKYNLNIHNFP